MSLLDDLLEVDLLATELKQILVGTPPSGVPEIYLAIRTDADPGPNLDQPQMLGDGTRANPFAANTAAQFNVVLRFKAQATNMTIHLGPGLFRTEGGYDSLSTAEGASPNPFRLFDGMRIVGAGMFNTVVRLVSRQGLVNRERQMSVIGGVLGDTTNNVEISDLTIDCNLGDQPWTPGKNYACMSQSAINLNGNNCRLRRVRLINFGTQRFPHNVCASRPYSGGGSDYIEINGATPSGYNNRCQVTSPEGGSWRHSITNNKSNQECHRAFTVRCGVRANAVNAPRKCRM
jgi:hypothetical protein